MTEGLNAAEPPNKSAAETQQLNLTDERGWQEGMQAYPGQMDLTGEAGWSPSPQPQESEEYRSLEFDNVGPAQPVDHLSEWEYSTYRKDEIARGGTPLSYDDWEKTGAAKVALKPPEAINPASETLTPEDLKRIDQESKLYFELLDEYFDNGEVTREPRSLARVIELRAELVAHEQAVKAAMLEEFQKLGVADINNERTMEQVVIDKVNEGVATARSRGISDLTRQNVRYSRERDYNRIEKTRESLAKLLAMTDEQFSRIQEDWEIHRMGRAHEAARKEDKTIKTGEQVKQARENIDNLNRQYGGVLDQISRLPLDKEPGGQTQAVIDDYQAKLQQINTRPDSLVDRSISYDVVRAQAVRDLEEQLKQKYQAEGLTPDQVQSRIQEAHGALDTWLQHTRVSTRTLDQLREFNSAHSKEQFWSARRQRTREFLVAAVLPRAIRARFGRGERRAETQELPNIDLKDTYRRAVDPDGSHARSGGRVLLGGGDSGGENLWHRAVSNVEQAHNLARNENGLLKAFLYLSLLPMGVEGGLEAAWRAIPNSAKEEVRKQFSLGRAATARWARRAKARAAEEARKQARIMAGKEAPPQTPIIDNLDLRRLSR